MQLLVMLLIAPLFILNMVGGIGAGIWLAILGQWSSLGIGIVAMLASHFLLGLLMMPGLALGAPAIYFANKGWSLVAAPFLLLTQAYTYVLIGGWCLLVFSFFMGKANAASFWPFLIWSYSVALAPWVYMAQQERRSGGGGPAAFTMTFAQIGYIAMGLVAANSHTNYNSAMWTFIGVLATGLVLQTGYAFVLMMAESRWRA